MSAVFAADRTLFGLGRGRLPLESRGLHRFGLALGTVLTVDGGLDGDAGVLA